MNNTQVSKLKLTQKSENILQCETMTPFSTSVLWPVSKSLHNKSKNYNTDKRSQ